MLERALGEVLPFRYPLEFGPSFYQSGRYPTKPELNSEPNSHRPTAYDDHLLLFRYDVPPDELLTNRSEVCQKARVLADEEAPEVYSFQGFTYELCLDVKPNGSVVTTQ